MEYSSTWRMFYFGVMTLTLAVVGLQTVSGCTEAEFQQCNVQVMGLIGQDFSAAGVMDIVCRPLGEAIDCMLNVLKNCPADKQKTARKLNKSLSKLQDICSEPASIDLSEISECPMAEFKQCLQNGFPSSQEKADQCLALGPMISCFPSFQDGCNSEFLNTLLSLLEQIIDVAKEECHSHGYRTTDGADSLRQIMLLPLLTSALALVWRHFL